MGKNTEQQIKATKQLRKNLDEQLQSIKTLDKCRETSLAITKLEECIMWLGQNLRRLNDGETAYTESMNPDNTIIHPTTDNLKF